ncbi:hypothetical protein MHYP_G00064780 [Metynnis hypsauchen]
MLYLNRDLFLRHQSQCFSFFYCSFPGKQWLSERLPAGRGRSCKYRKKSVRWRDGGGGGRQAVHPTRNPAES